MAACWSSALLAASDAVPQMAPADEDEGDKICVELASLRFQKRNNEHGHAYRVCQILLYCVFPGSGMLGLERADQDLTVTGSDGMELEITRTELSGFSVKVPNPLKFSSRTLWVYFTKCQKILQAIFNILYKLFFIIFFQRLHPSQTNL